MGADASRFKGQPSGTIRLEQDIVQSALRSKDQQAAHDILFQVVERLASAPQHPDSDALFISTVLELSTLCFALGQSFSNVFVFLKSAAVLAQRHGNRRSNALILLHLGRIYYLGERRLDAMEVFSEGKRIIEELGDEDILIRAGEFLGLYHHMQGLFREAMEHFQRAVDSYETHGESRLINPSAAMWMCYCEAYLGLFPRAVGRLDYYRRIATERADHHLATTLRSALGIILIMIRKISDASLHASIALKQAIDSGNALAHYFALGALGEVNLYSGHPEKGREMFAESLRVAAGAGIIRQYASPSVLEMLYEFHRMGLDPIPDFSFHRESHRVMNEPNLHLKGVALRLKAMDTAAIHGDLNEIDRDLETSTEYLIRCGDPIQLGKTRIEMTRLRLKRNQMDKARAMAMKAWENFYGYGDVFYPDDLRHLLDSNTRMLFLTSHDEFLNRFMELFEELLPTTDINQLLTRAIAATNKFFGAERGGLFWFNPKNTRQAPMLRAACNLTRQEVLSKAFRPHLTSIFDAFRENKPIVSRMRDDGPHKVKALLCLPFEREGRPQGVLYHDNSYIDDCFDFLEPMQLRKIANSLSNYIDGVLRFSQKLEEAAVSSPGGIIHIDPSDPPEMVAQSPAMQKILYQADRIAGSDGTVLILGETGVGKELMAQRIHKKSKRCEGPLVVVDMTTIAESLVESELFGHEKGAFTGADRQKKGRLELAHKGTLFIDELGEIPKGIQVKLLRAIQEKAFVRVGGTRTLTADFRLVAATNRDLSEEVASGNFRKDLYYRLSTLPLVIPPLRERSEDIVLLAEHFLSRYTVKHGGPNYQLTPEHKAMLRDYYWPGNVRELINVIERAVLLSTGGYLELDLPGEKKNPAVFTETEDLTLNEVQRRYIKHVLEKTQGKISGPGGAAEILGMQRTSLYSRMSKLGLR